MRTVAVVLLGVAVLCPGVAAAETETETETETATATATATETDACDGVIGGCFLDRDGSLRDADDAYRALVARGRAHVLRASIQQAIALGIGTTWYWLDRERQVSDWDYPSIRQRFTFEAWRFDNNPFPINFIWHPVNGSGFHIIGRSNELGLLGATGLGFAASMVWELVIEFREKVSINDVIVTTGAGVTFGEFFHWLGRYLASAPGRGRSWHGVARWTAGFPWTFHETWDGRHQTLTGAPDELGLSADIWHRFRVGYGFALGRVPGDGGLTAHHLQFDGALAALPGYLRPGHFRRPFFDGNLTALSLRLSGGAGRVNADLFGDTLLVGVHDQAIDHPADGGVGRAVTAGVSIAYRYRNETYGAFRDRLGIMHLPGPALEGHLIGPRWRLRAAVRAHADFAALHALPYPEWKAANPDVRDKTILDRHRYYFGWGVSGRLRAELELPRVALGGAVFRGRYASQEGYDRSQELVELDVSASDTVADYDAWLRVTPLARSRAYLELRASRRDRGARVGDVRAEQGVRLVTLELGAAL